MSLEILHELFKVIEDRRDRPKPNSYTSGLMSRGLSEVLKKVKEESLELIEAAQGSDRDAIIHEAADLIFHTLVLLAFKYVTLDEILKELEERRRKR